MGLLDGGAAALFGSIFQGIFLPATVRDASADLTYDAQGTLSRTAGNPRSCRVQVDRATARWRDEPGFSATDVSIIVLATSLDGRVEVGNIITVETGPYANTPYRLAAPIERDPAGAGWVARGVQVRSANG